MGGGVGGVGTNVPDGGQIFFGPGDRSGESSPRLVRVRAWIMAAGDCISLGLHWPIIAQKKEAAAQPCSGPLSEF